MAASLMRWNSESLRCLGSLLGRTVEAGIGPKSIASEGREGANGYNT
jgi:hypothetical protein